jgi:hypothetical protein
MPFGGRLCLSCLVVIAMTVDTLCDVVAFYLAVLHGSLEGVGMELDLCVNYSLCVEIVLLKHIPGSAASDDIVVDNQGGIWMYANSRVDRCYYYLTQDEILNRSLHKIIWPIDENPLMK